MTEAIYDAKIAPALKRVMEICAKEGMGMLAVVEFGKGEIGRSEVAPQGSCMEMHITRMAARCHGNIDALIMGIMKYARAHGHSSIFLKQLGVPLNPPVLGADAPTQPKGN